MKRAKPLLLSLLIILLDQLSKAWVCWKIPENTVYGRYFWDFLWIVHVRNDAVAFSFGHAFPLACKYLLFVLLPFALMALLCLYLLSARSRRDFSEKEIWALAGILGGGVGNLIDRLFRGLRVVDFISTDMYGFLGFSRWPTYNLADASVVVSVCFLLLFSLETKGKK